MMEQADFDDVPFEPADYGRIKVERHDGGVYLVSWKEALRMEPQHAITLGKDLQKTAQLVRM